MEWNLTHENVGVTVDSKIISRSSILFKNSGITIRIADTLEPLDHILGSKQVLVETAYKFEQIAREMKNKADKL